MKIKNFAFFGVMASILGICAANADTPTAKRIASTHYVDEAVAPKQNQLKDGSGANANDMNAVVKQTVAAGTQADPTSEQALVSEKAVRDAITTATADVSGKVDIVQGQPNANHIVITDASGNVTTAATIPNTQVSGLGTAATRDAGAFQAYADSTVGPGTYNVISDGNQVGKNLIKLDDGKQNKSDSRVPNSDQYAVIQPGLNVGTNLVALDAEVRNLNNNLSNRQLASASAVPTLQEGSYNAITSGNNVGTNLVALDTALDDKEDVANKKALGSSTWAQVTEKTSDTKYPSMAVLNAAVNSATFSGEYEDMNNVLPDINNTNDWSAANNCTDSNPCVLTMQSGGRFVWTNMVLQ